MFTTRVIVTPTADGRPTVIERLCQEAAEVPAMFDGCNLFVVSIDLIDPEHVVISEEWVDPASFDAYQSSGYFTETMALLGPLLAGAPDAAYFESTLVGP